MVIYNNPVCIMHHIITVYKMLCLTGDALILYDVSTIAQGIVIVDNYPEPILIIYKKTPQWEILKTCMTRMPLKKLKNW